MVVIIAMLVIILLPATMVSLPLSKMVITVSNAGAEKLVTVSIIVYGADDGYFDFILMPGDERAVTCPIKTGTYDVRIRYWFSGEENYDQRIWESYSVYPFETEKAKFNLAPLLVAGTGS